MGEQLLSSYIYNVILNPSKMLHLSRKYILLLLLLPLWSSCEKNYTCSFDYYYIGVHVSFGGYTPAELSNIVLQKFEPGSNFSVLLSSDTINASNATFEGDTAYLAIEPSFHRGFFTLTADNDYKIKMLTAGNREYAMNLTKGATSYTWTQTRHCSPGASQARISPFNVNLDGTGIKLYSTSTNNYFICLRR